MTKFFKIFAIAPGLLLGLALMLWLGLKVSNFVDSSRDWNYPMIGKASQRSSSTGFATTIEEFIHKFNAVSPVNGAFVFSTNGKRDFDIHGAHFSEKDWGGWGSISKTLTAAALVEASARGLFSLNDSVCKILRLSCDTSKSRIRVVDLLDHRSGLPYLDRNFLWEWISSLRIAFSRDWDTRKEIFDAFERSKIKNYGDFLYSNLGMDVAGLVLESVTKLELNEAIHHFVDPKKTMTFECPISTERRKKDFTDYAFERFFSAGSCAGPVGSLEQFGRNLLAQKDEWAKAVFAHNSKIYTLGWVRTTNPKTGEVIYWHNGETLGVKSDLIVFPESGKIFAWTIRQFPLQRAQRKSLEELDSFIFGTE